MKTTLIGLIALSAGAFLGVTLEANLGLIRPHVQTFSFETHPEHTQVQLSDGQSCHSPCSLQLFVDEPLSIKMTTPLPAPLSFETAPVTNMQILLSDGQSCQAPCTVQPQTNQNQPLTVKVIDAARIEREERLKKIVPLW